MPTQTATKLQDGEPLLVGKWLVEPTLNRLTRGGISVQVELKAMDVLLCLVEHSGEVVSKNDLLDAVWQTEFVSDTTLQVRIAQLREALGDDAQNPGYIETIRKRGYRLIAEIGTPADADASPALPELPSTHEEERNPYPGLAAFTEADADVFFGREREVAALWRKIASRRLLALIGPSGIGKSSLLRAGVATGAPPGWRVIVFSPGEGPAMSLARALAPDHAGDPAAVTRLVGFNDADTALAVVSRWREHFEEVVLVVDQFEELFTLNPAETQSKFVGLLRRLVDAADVHIVLAMRDDFLYQCQRYPEISPIFDGLNPLGPPDGEALRRAITEPAARQLHRFESAVLVDRMIAEVEDQRGALPLLAFAIRRLWEKRDRDERVLTEAAYESIGGVAGALALHAEAIMGEIGHERLPVVREIFRNLVTSESTRAVREIDEVLSVFDGGGGEGMNPSPTTIMATSSVKTVGAGFSSARDSAREVLDKLIAARLLTTFETHDDEDLTTRRVEIVHESLLANWPRLVRWQTQDQESAQLRDELRHAAKIWDEHGRHNDRLWTGTAYREFRLWSERYPGGLTQVEERFAESMTSFANRRNRRRVYAVAASFVALLMVLVVVGSFWRRSENETRRAEAANLIALGQLELDSYPSATIAHAIASLEQSDGPIARKLALEALWKGPAAIIVNEQRTAQAQFTSDGRWLIQSQSNPETGPLRLIGAGGSSQILERTKGGHAARREIGFESGIFGLQGWADEGKTSTASVWSAPEKTRLVEARYGPGAVMGWNLAIRSDQRRMTVAIREKDGRVAIDALSFDGNTTRLGTIDLDLEVDEVGWLVDMNRRGQWVAASTGHEIYVVEVGDRGLSDPRFLGRQESGVTGVGMDERGRFVATTDAECRVRLWDLDGTMPPIQVQGPPPPSRCDLRTPFGLEDLLVAISQKAELRIDQLWIWSVETGEPKLLRRFDFGDWGGYCQNATHLVKTGPDPKTRLWPYAAPADAEPIVLLRGEIGHLGYPRIHPGGEWLVVPDIHGLSLWPLARTYPAVIRRHHKEIQDLEFGPEGRWLASSSTDGTVRIWPLTGEAPPPGQILLDDPTTWFYGLARSPDGSQLSVSDGGILLLPLDEDPPVTGADRVADHSGYWNTAFSADGHRLTSSSAEDGKIRVWDVASREQVAVLTAGESRFSADPQFIDSNHLMALDNSGLHRWKIDTGESDLLVEGAFQTYDVSEDRRRVLLLEAATEDDLGQAVFVDLETGETTALESHGRRVYEVALDAAGRFVVTADRDGVIRVGPITGEEPHLLFGHENSVTALAVDPEGRWIASGSEDETVRLWPMPDLTKPPLHTLPREELIAKLKTLTNLRVVRDPESSTGWNLTHDPFPGWETVPSW